MRRDELEKPDGVPYIDYLPDNAEEALANTPVMAARCAGCAFTAGTEAHAHPITSQLRDDCVAARCAFFCHMTSGGVTCTHLCAGWLNSIQPTK